MFTKEELEILLDSLDNAGRVYRRLEKEFWRKDEVVADVMHERQLICERLMYRLKKENFTHEK